MSPQSSPSHMLTLINNTILLSDACTMAVQPHSAIECTFDLKFEVIYKTQVTPSSIQKNIFSPKLGIRLFTDEQKSVSFYSPSLATIEAWICCLSKKINQKGFHEMFKPLKKLGKGNFASVYEV